jgi:hypothetical protein
MNTSFDELTCGLSIHAFQMLLNVVINDLGVMLGDSIHQYIDQLKPKNDSPALRARIDITLTCFNPMKNDGKMVEMLRKFPSKDPLVMGIIIGMLFDFIYTHPTEMNGVFLKYLETATDMSSNPQREDPRFGEGGLLYIAEMMKNIHICADTIHKIVSRVKELGRNGTYFPDVSVLPYTKNDQPTEIIIASYSYLKNGVV